MKRFKILILMIILCIFIGNLSYAQDEGNVYVVPIKGEIDKVTYQFLKSTLKDISIKEPSAIIFEIDTYGGLISEAEKIKKLILDLDVPTISFVNNKAESAGVLLTISSQKVVMAKSSTIGSAETIPNTQKVMSMWLSFLRDVAQLRNKNPEVIEAMADKDIEIEGIKEKGEILNLNSREAKKYGVADYISNNYEDMLNYFNISYNKVVNVDENMKVKIAKFVINPFVSTLLLTLGFLGLIIEIFTPGFGLGGTLSIVSFALFFGGNILAGNSQWTSLILFVAGLVLIIIEIIVPGFGLPGISGIALIVIGVILAMDSVARAVTSLSIAIILTAFITVLLVKFGKKNPYFNKVVLSTRQKNEEGYLSSNVEDKYLDRIGIAITELRPTGIIEIEGRRIDALSEGNYIDKGSKVKVVKIEGSKIIVRRM